MASQNVAQVEYHEIALNIVVNKNLLEPPSEEVFIEGDCLKTGTEQTASMGRPRHPRTSSPSLRKAVSWLYGKSLAWYNRHPKWGDAFSNLIVGVLGGLLVNYCSGGGNECIISPAEVARVSVNGTQCQ